MFTKEDGSFEVSGLREVDHNIRTRLMGLADEWISEIPAGSEDMVIYSCGPEPMLAKVAQIAGEKNIDCQVSMERMMGCGIGLCQSCAV